MQIYIPFSIFQTYQQKYLFSLHKIPQMYYDSTEIYISSASNLREKIARIDAIITALEAAALKGAATGHLDEVSLDDGQTKIKTLYRNATQIAASITQFEAIKQRYVNQLNGRSMRLVDGKNFLNTRYNGR